MYAKFKVFRYFDNHIGQLHLYSVTHCATEDLTIFYTVIVRFE